MKLLVVMDAWDPPEDSHLRWGADIVRALAARGHQIRVLTGLAPAHPQTPAHVTLEAWIDRPAAGGLDWFAFHQWAAEQVRAPGAPFSLSFSPLVPARLIHPCARAGPALAPRGEPEHWPWPVALIKAWKRRRLPQTPPVEDREQQALTDALVSHIISLSRLMDASLRQIPGLDSSRLHPLRPGVAASSLSLEDAGNMRHWTRSALSLEPQDCVVLFSTLHADPSVVSAAFAAFDQVMRTQPSLRIIVTGPMMYFHHDAAVTLGLRDRIRLIPTAGHMHNLLAAADLTLTLSPAMCSRIVIEALAQGIPVITQQNDGAAEYLITPQGHLAGQVLSQAWDEAELGEALELLCQPAPLQAARSCAAELASTFSLEAHVQALEALLT